MSNIEEKFGIVVLLDALGVQIASIPESKRFVNLLEQYSKGSLAHIGGYASAGDGALAVGECECGWKQDTCGCLEKQGGQLQTLTGH